jgi:hypothetical protein
MKSVRGDALVGPGDRGDRGHTPGESSLGSVGVLRNPVEPLPGARRNVLDKLHRRGIEIRVYIPYRAHGFRYCGRRLTIERRAARPR